MEDLPALEAESKKNGYASFMWGPAGVFAVQFVTHSLLNATSTAQSAMNEIHKIILTNSFTHNDFLPGRAGLLFAARFVEANNPLALPLPWTDEDLMAVAQAIISDGVSPDRAYMQWNLPTDWKMQVSPRRALHSFGTCILYPIRVCARHAPALVSFAQRIRRLT